MHLVNLNEYRAKDLVNALEALLELSKSGDVRGLSFAADLSGRRAPVLGVCGSHKRDPSKALSAVTCLKGKLMRLSEEEEGEEVPDFIESRR